VTSIVVSRGVNTVVLFADVASPGKPTWSSLLGHWSIDPLFVLIVATAILYFAGVRRLAGQGRAWPISRSLAFGSGVTLIAFATQSGLAQYDRVLFSLHVVQHLLLGMAAPLLLVLGAPVTLALQAGSRSFQMRVLRVLHSRSVAVLTHPIIVWVLFTGTLAGLYFSGLYELSLRNDWVHVLVHLHFVVVGFLFMAYVVGLDRMPRTLGHGARVLFVAFVLPFHAFFGVALLGSRTVIAAAWYEQARPVWTESPLGDQRLGAAMLWGFGEIFGLVALGIILYQWMRYDERDAARLDRRLEREEFR
jgi:putative membrane protein